VPPAPIPATSSSSDSAAASGDERSATSTDLSGERDLSGDGPSATSTTPGDLSGKRDLYGGHLRVIPDGKPQPDPANRANPDDPAQNAQQPNGANAGAQQPYKPPLLGWLGGELGAADLGGAAVSDFTSSTFSSNIWPMAEKMNEQQRHKPEHKTKRVLAQNEPRFANCAARILRGPSASPATRADETVRSTVAAFLIHRQRTNTTIAFLFTNHDGQTSSFHIL